MFTLLTFDGLVHITGTEAAQSPCTALTQHLWRMKTVGEYVNVHDAIANAQQYAKQAKIKVCRHCLAAAKRI